MTRNEATGAALTIAAGVHETVAWRRPVVAETEEGAPGDFAGVAFTADVEASVVPPGPTLWTEKEYEVPFVSPVTLQRSCSGPFDGTV